jgi:hypothetical protein
MKMKNNIATLDNFIRLSPSYVYWPPTNADESLLFISSRYRLKYHPLCQPESIRKINIGKIVKFYLFW